MRLVILLAAMICIFFVRATGANYYWVGGSGNWNELIHWATTSGGSTSHTQIPTALDHVFFDAGSFTGAGQVVTINVTEALCNNMDWTGVTYNPTLDGVAANTLRIYGSLRLVAGMTLNFQGLVRFESSTTGNTITSAGHSFGGNSGNSTTIEFNGDGGDWTLQDNLTTTGIINLNNGTLNTNNQTVNAGAFSSINPAARTLNMGSSIFNLVYGWEVIATGMTLNAGISAINITYSGLVVSFSGGGLDYYDLHFTGALTAYAEINGNNTFHDVSFSSDGITRSNNSFNSLTFFRNGTIYGDNVYTNLIFTAGYLYTLATGKTQTINESFTASGNCNALITINTNLAGSQSTISHPPGAVTFSYVTLKDIIATGGATFTANNAVDLGNNTGWIINTLNSRDLYWVGNTGNWNDGNHWSTTSGGSPSGCSPNPVDNVYFDGNSFSAGGQTVTINGPVAYCNNIIWTGATNNPVLAGTTSDRLVVCGSLRFVPGMTLSFAGPVSFEATTAGNMITTAGKSFINTVTFNGIGGSWTLQDALTTSKTIFLTNGALNTNNQTVTATAFLSYSFTTRMITMGSSVFNLSNAAICWDIFNTGMTLNAGTSIINVVNPGGSSFSGGGFAYYNLNFTGPGTINGNNTFNDVLFADDGIIWDNNTFNNVTFLKNGNIYNNNTYNNLTFTAGYNYLLANGKTQTVNILLTANGSCASRITINTDIPGSQSAIYHPPGSVTLVYLALKDINATGGATFTANSTIDLGNNTGWIINTPVSKDLYWIGNSGNWNDGNHWSTTSGGVPSGCSPTPLDNVFFDVNSFSAGGQTVTINVPVAFCKSMDWTGATDNPALAGVLTSLLKIYGSLTFIKGMNLFFRGAVNFEATTTGQTITSARQPFDNAIIFNGVGGEWTLQDTLTTSGVIHLNNGTLITNDQTVNAGGIFSYTASARKLLMGSSVINLSNGGLFWDIASAGMIIDAGTSTINAIDVSNPQLTFRSNGFTYYNLNFISSSSQSSGVIYGNNTFNDVFFNAGSIIKDNNSFNNVTISRNGTIEGNNTYSNLTFTAGYTYTLSSEKTQTIVNKWKIHGTCDSSIILQSSTAGSPSYISKTSNTVSGYNMHIGDIHCAGGAIFNAYNSVDLGGNYNWNFLTLPPLSVPGIINGPVAACNGQTGIVYNTASMPGAISYTWTVPSGATIASGQGDTAIVVNFDGTVSGNITVAAFNGCEFSPVSTLTIQIAAPVANAGLDGSVCSGVPFAIAGAGATNYSALSWTTNGTGIFTNNGTLTPTYTPGTADIAAGTVILTLTATGNAACPNPSEDAVTLTIIPSITAAVNIAAVPAGPVCAGTSVTLTATPTNGIIAPTYIWYINGLAAGTNSPTFASNTLANGAIINCAMISNAACVSPDTAVSKNISLTINARPMVNLDDDSLLCRGNIRLLDAGQGGIFYLWNDGSTASTMPVNAAGTYWVQVTTTNGCIGADTIQIKRIISPPEKFLPNDTSLCLSSSMLLKPVVDYNTYLWNNNSTQGSIIISQAGTYWLNATDKNGCTGNDTIEITMKPCYRGFHIPNAFTPNNDTKNELFKPLLNGDVKHYYFVVYNRWGQIVFQTNDSTKGWDGLFKGKIQDSNVFVWMCRYQLAGEQLKLEKGTVVLAR